MPDDDPRDRPADDDEPGREPNPFAGTPMEQIFSAMGGPGGQAPDLGALFGQMQRMFSSQHDGAVDFDVVKDVARHALAAQGEDPSPHSGQVNAVDDAIRLADTWLDRATSLPRAVTKTSAWSRAEWIEQTSATWQQLIEPIAEHVVEAMSDALPQEAKAMAGPLLGILKQAGGAMFAQQIGQALSALSLEVLSGTDVGLPLAATGHAALLPANVAAYGEGLEQREADVLLHVALREAAHQRLYAHAGWLRPAIIGAIEEFGRNTRIDLSAMESQLQGLDPTDPEAVAEAMQGGMFEPEPTPEQRQALHRLETLLAFVEGWVDEVVDQATRETMPAAPALAEAVRRRRATGGPAEQTFASLVGLELRPRRLRDAASLWAALRDRQGPDARDAVWSHPDLMPTAEDLDDPLGFATGEGRARDAVDAELDRLLDGDDGQDGPDDEQGGPSGPDSDGPSGPGNGPIGFHL
ncbi:MAG: zinc-dependent metalloprotease [Aeromicrobium erythreum]